ncbi:MAG: type I secretion system permease/ATPase [Pararhodobacter sp.]
MVAYGFSAEQRPGFRLKAGAGRHAARAALLRGNTAILACAIGFGILVNLLMLTGPVFMLQVYDRVLAARSEATLVALFGLVCFLYAMMALLDHARGRLMARIGARFQARLDRQLFDAGLARCAVQPGDRRAAQIQGDVEMVQRLLGTPLITALQDAVWTPLFIALIFAFHSQLGLLALAGALVLLGLAALNRLRLARPAERAAHAGVAAQRLGLSFQQQADSLVALGMRRHALGQWARPRALALGQGILASDRAGFYNAIARSFRLFLQSAMLALGAWLVIQEQISPGVMIAASIMLGRALAPLEQTVMQWPALQAAFRGWQRVVAFLQAQPPPVPRMALPRPSARLVVDSVSVFPPGAAVAALRLLDFTLAPGRALGVIGPSGAGKSSLARCLTGVWPPAAGTVRLGDVPLNQFDTDVLGGLIGYVPQRITLFEGSVADNIARLDPDADPARVVQAAEHAGVHRMILALPQGYDTPIMADGAPLSGGQMQGIALARAFFGDPLMLVLDEPNAHLDAEGASALNRAIRAAKARGMAVVIMAHRPAAIQECDDLLVLEGGVQTAFGPRDAVLRDRVRNHTEIVQAATGAGATPPSSEGLGR